MKGKFEIEIEILPFPLKMYYCILRTMSLIFYPILNLLVILSDSHGDNYNSNYYLFLQPYCYLTAISIIEILETGCYCFPFSILIFHSIWLWFSYMEWENSQRTTKFYKCFWEWLKETKIILTTKLRAGKSCYKNASFSLFQLLELIFKFSINWIASLSLFFFIDPCGYA